jgi:hypothetical protein
MDTETAKALVIATAKSIPFKTRFTFESATSGDTVFLTVVSSPPIRFTTVLFNLKEVTKASRQAAGIYRLVETRIRETLGMRKKN